MKSPCRYIMLTLTIAALTACESPMALDDDPPAPPQPDWTGPSSVVGDPLLEVLPSHLMEQAATAPLRTAMVELKVSVAARNLVRVRTALARLAQERQAYASHPTFRQGDLPILAAIELFELRLTGILERLGLPLLASYDGGVGATTVDGRGSR